LEYKNRLRIDLHIHSTASDGSLTPADIIDHAQKLNLAAIAITDHDSVDGSKEALQIGIPPSLHFLTGVEISAAHPPFFPGSGSFHILGYAIHLDNRDLNQALSKLQDARKNRNPEILKRLNKLGFRISLEEVNQEVGEGQLGRPHIAYAMLKKGFVASINEAFDKYLGNAGPAYVDKDRIECEQAINIIRAAGGVPVLAHPALLNIDNDQNLDALRQIRQYTELAEKYGLLMTGGTDFHGSITPDTKMGSGNGDLFVPYTLYKELINANKRSFRD
jgi:predicted metal-dependent phosphoesterase TrpH